MKKTLLEFVNNDWAVWWFLFGMAFFVLATIDAVNGENTRAIGLMGICMGCHARCEVEILQRKIEKNEHDISTTGKA